MIYSRFIVVFATPRSFLLGRTLIEQSGLSFRTINTPRTFYEQCGLCLLFDSSERESVEAVLSPSRPDLLFLDYDED